MKKFVRSATNAVIMIVLMIGLSGCTKEGPVEKAGDQIEKAGEKVKDAVK